MKLTRPLFAQHASGKDPFLGTFRRTRYGPVLASPKYHITRATYARPARNHAFTRAVIATQQAATTNRADTRALLAIHLSRSTQATNPTGANQTTIETPATYHTATLI